MNGWICLHRKFLEWEWYHDINTKILFIHLLLKANHKPNRWKGVEIKRGEFVTGRKVLSKETGLSEQQIRTSLSKLKSTSEITSKSTSRNTVISILNYDKYQDDQQAKQQTNNKQVTTNNNDNNIIFNKLNIIIDQQNFSKDFMPVFKTWFDYKKARKESYKNDTSILAFCKKLIKLSGNSAKIAQEIIEQSIANNWAGIFELKKGENYGERQDVNKKPKKSGWTLDPDR